jgi:hypothetical protein
VPFCERVLPKGFCAKCRRVGAACLRVTAVAAQKVITFLSSNAIALASLCIVFMGLYLTITAQREDREHKELMIRPSLIMHVEVDDFSFVLTNSGLGPAVIKDAVYRLDGKCIYPQNESAKTFAKDDYLEIVNYIDAGFGSLVDSAKWKSDFKVAPSSRVAMPLPTQIMAVGEQLVMYKSGSEFTSELHSKLR